MTHRAVHRGAESSEDDGMLSPMFSMELDPSKLGENCAASSRAPATTDGRRWRPPASRPGMGPIGGRDWHRNAMGFDGMDDMDTVWQTCRQASAFEERLAADVAAFKDQCRVGGGDVALRILGNMLRERGYHIEVVDGNTGRTGHHDVWHHLRHSYLVCTGWSDNTTVAIPEFPSQDVIIDVGFRERFEVAHATLAYERLLQVVPEDFVGGRDQLKRVVRIMCDQMASSFKQCGLLLPPWRTYRAVLSMWSGLQAQGLQRGCGAKTRA